MQQQLIKLRSLFKERRRLSGASLVAAVSTAVLVLLVAACGGGSDTAPAGGGGGSGSGGGDGGGTAGPTGTLWHSSLATDGAAGSKLSGFTAATTRAVDRKPTAVPTRDGLRYATWEYDSRPAQLNTTIEVKSHATGAVIHSAVLNGYVRNLRPSPASASLLLVTWSTSATTNDPEEIILDLAQRRVVEILGGADVAANWFANGDYLLLLTDGTLFRSRPGSARVAAGQVAVAGRVPRGLWISPNETEMLTQWRTLQGDEVLKDLWISNINGSALSRWTATNVSDKPVWSHDGRFVGYRNLAERICAGFSCPTARCDVQYAPAASRNLALADARATNFRVVNGSGSTTVTLGCELNGWTP